jgi:anti-sigma factor (TIGR02949 family)
VNCEVVLEKLSCYADRVVDEATMEMIESHLAGCPECRAELKAIEAMQASLLTVAEVDPPARLSFSIREAISREEHSVHAECDHVVAMLSEYVDGELVRDDVLVVRSHVEACESCAHELALTQSLVTAAAASFAVEAPVELRARIMAATVESATPLQKLAEKVVTALRPARAALVGATAVAAAAVILMVGRPNNPPAGVDTDKVANNPTSTIRPNVPKVEVADKSVVAAALETSNVAVRQSAHRVHSHRRVLIAAVPAGASKADVKKPTMSIAQKSDDTREVVASNVETLKTIEPAVDEKPAEPALITISDAEAKKVIAEAAAAEKADKKSPVKIAAGQPIVLPDDDRAMIKSIKQQLKMQKKGEIISVDLLGSKF